MSEKVSYLDDPDFFEDLQKAYLEALASKYVSISRGNYSEFEKALDRAETLRRVLVSFQMTLGTK